MNKALLIIDMQNDYLWDKRKKKFSYNTEELVNNVNNTINRYKKDCDIIYISHLIQNLPTNKFLFGFSIEGTKGAELYDKLKIVSNLKFNKYFGDAYTSKAFDEHIEKNNYDTVYICGLDECGCVYHTAKGALKRHKEVYIIKDATACRYSKNKLNKKRNELISLGIKYI